MSRRFKTKEISKRKIHRQAKLLVKKNRSKHKKILLHPASIFFLLCVGVLIAGLTYKTIADSFSVTAKVAAPQLTEGAVITYPADGQTFSTSPITVTGTCPPNSYIVLYRNSAFSGSAWCSNNTFSILTSLSIGTNSLQAQDFNITDDPGPATTPVIITYSPPVNKSSISTNYPNNPVPPLILTSDYHFRAFFAGSNFSWPISIYGGIKPYRVLIDWGDGSNKEINLPDSQQFSINHTYKTAGYYPIIIKATDSSSDNAALQIAALIKNSGAVGFSTNPTPPKTEHQNIWQILKNWLWLIWPMYIVVLLMVISYWLGERHETEIILRRKYLSKKKHA